jgi:uncharacterized protein with HEPN domain
MPRDYKLYLQDIREAIQKIERYVGQANYEEFAANDLMRDAVLYNLQVIGEAANHLPFRLKAERPSIEWQEIVGLRNVVTHAYFSIAFETIWDVILNNLPSLLRTVEDMLAHEEE